MIGRNMLSQLEHLVRPLATRVANSIARAVVQVVDDSTKMQLLQIGVLAGEDIDDAERFQEYGFSSAPHPGAEAVVLFPNGDRAHPLVVAVDDRRYRPTGAQPGEVVLYTDEGDEVRLGRGQVMTLAAGMALLLGGASASEGVLKGDGYRAAEDAFFAAVVAAIGALPGGAGAATTLQTALDAFELAVANSVSTKVKAE